MSILFSSHFPFYSFYQGHLTLLSNVDSMTTPTIKWISIKEQLKGLYYVSFYLPLLNPPHLYQNKFSTPPSDHHHPSIHHQVMRIFRCQLLETINKAIKIHNNNNQPLIDRLERLEMN